MLCVFQLNAQSWQEWRSKSDWEDRHYDMAAAANYMEKALDLVQRKTPNRDVVDTLTISLSVLYTICMKYDKAVPLLKKVIAENREQGKYKLAYVRALTHLAAASIYYEQYDSARLLLAQSDSIRIASFAQNKFLQTENLLAFARYYMVTGSLDSALTCCEEANQLYKHATQNHMAAHSLTLSIAGYICLQMGDWFGARKYMNEFISLIKSPLQNYHPYVMESSIYLAEYTAMKGDYKNVQDLYKTSFFLIHAKLGLNNPLALVCHNNLGMQLLRMQRCSEAQNQFHRLLNLLKENRLENSFMYLTTKNNEGLTYLMTGKYEQAKVVFDTLLQTAEKKLGKEHNLYGEMLYNAAWTNSSLHMIDEAAREMIQADNIHKNLLIAAISRMSEKDQLNMYNMSEVYFQMLPSFVHIHRNYKNDSLLLALFEEQSFLKGPVSINKQRALSHIRGSADSLVAGQIDQWDSLRRLRADADAHKKPKQYADSLVAQINLLERNMLYKASPFKEVQASLTPSYAAIAGKLKQDEVAVEFIRYRLFQNTWTDSIWYAALVIEPGAQAPRFVDLCTEEQLLSVLHPYYADSLEGNYLNRLYKDPQYVKGKTYGSDSLYRLVWRPLDAYLQNKKQVFLSPIGLLHLVSFSALPDKDGMLIDRYEVHRLKHISGLLTDTEPVDITENIELWGAINYEGSAKANKTVQRANNTSTMQPDTSWHTLPGTRKEITGIKKIFEQQGRHVKLFTDAQATRELFMSTARTRPAILHIATHGFYTKDTLEQPGTMPGVWSFNISKSRDPLLRSGLVFAGANQAARLDSSRKVNAAILTSYDIASLDLSRVRLAVLSACETALGDLERGEGVFGLQRALQIAGVDKMVLALWPVDDQTTQVFMSRFYTRLASGSSVQKAFSATQRSMVKAYEPKQWAGFVLIE